MGIKHDDVKATGEKGFASEWNKNHVVDGDIDMVQNQLLNNVIENRTDFPAGPVEGQAVYRTDLNAFYIYNGAGWDDFTPQIYTAGEGIDVVANVISGENATTANKGIASFNTNDFSVAAGAVSLKNKTSYWSIPGSGFMVQTESQNYARYHSGKYEAQDFAALISAPVTLPHGAIITSVVVYGTNTSRVWTLARRELDSAETTYFEIASADIDSSDAANHTVDNSTSRYTIFVVNSQAGEFIHGARITYTTDYD